MWNEHLICRLYASSCTRPMQASGVPPLTRWSFSNCTWSCFLREDEPLGNSCGMQQIGRAVLWYIGYDLGEPLPDHSSLNRIRERDARGGVPPLLRHNRRIRKAGRSWSGGERCTSIARKSTPMPTSIRLSPRFAVEAREAILFR